MKIPGVAWRTLTGYDMPAVEKIAATVHPDFPESYDVLAERQRLYHNGTYLLEIGERPAGYVLSHPWVLGTLPALNTLIGELPAGADTYYIHDLALLPVARRIGAASYITEALAKHARAHGFPTMSLVAVNGSQGFWERHEFQIADAPHLRDKLKSYEEAAVLMVRRL
ncbi:MAG TPA: GNAT family N-acetyltransferase [Hypericibacter adhaerens]|uniref:GNAT family N-acetyltransferase n=1 Tax=Hypericibacter adhaerens TaxID=2602016 RepID=UPI002BDD4209|nr:GNAT family N-acetyltransferase [Hypericibacter adhaerens]HWA44002.1 GNAT family N-acetyltransferase [Hypericibacter adhaerens]